MTGELYHLYYEEMVHWAVSMTKNLSSAEDLVQETFLRAMKNEELFKGMEFYQCRSWLYRTARNLYVDWVRHATHEVITETMPEQGEISRDFQNLESFSGGEWTSDASPGCRRRGASLQKDYRQWKCKISGKHGGSTGKYDGKRSDLLLPRRKYFVGRRFTHG